MRRPNSISARRKAHLLRTKGFSIGDIAKKLFIAKSTAYEWTKSMEGAARFAQIGRERWMRELQPLGALAQRKKREIKIEHIIKEAKKKASGIQITDDICLSVLSVLYWAEGAKGRGMLTFTNTDPRLMLLFITLLRRCFELDESKFRVRIHIHWYHKDREVKKYWSTLLKIPQQQFYKSFHKKRSKEKVFRKNIGGICFLRYNNSDLREQIVNFSFAFGERFTKSQAPIVQRIE